jgi:uncharacterized protein
MLIRVLLLLAVVVAVFWLARAGRRRDAGRRDPAAPPTPPAREEMVACRQCGLHLPRGEALRGRGALFCSEAHRAAFEQAQG